MSIMFTNFEPKFDKCNTAFEKSLKILPPNLKFIKKYIYNDLFFKLNSLIDDLEQVRNSNNFDENLILLRPLNVIKFNFKITCVDFFTEHNIKHMNSNKVIYGLNNGSIIIYDLETNRVILEKVNVTSNKENKNRVDIIQTSTIKYFDSYISRIACYLRGESTVSIYSFNHSFNVLNLESIINIKEEKSSLNNNNNTINKDIPLLKNLVANLKDRKSVV